MNNQPAKEVEEYCVTYYGIPSILVDLIELDFMEQFVLTDLPFMYEGHTVHKYWNVFPNINNFSNFVFKSC